MGYEYIYFSTCSYEIQEEGPVQQISYVSEKEQGYLRLIAEEPLDQLRLVLDNGHDEIFIDKLMPIQPFTKLHN